MKKLDEEQQQLTEDLFQITRSMVSRIKNRKRWRSLQ